MNCKIEEKEAFYVLEKISRHTTAGGRNKQSVPDFWTACREDGSLEALLSATDGTVLYGICYGASGEEFDYSIAARCEKDSPVTDGFQKRLIPARTWAVFECVGAMPQAIQRAWDNAWKSLPAGYRPTGEFDFEVYPDGDADDPHYRSEIRLPVEKS